MITIGEHPLGLGEIRAALAGPVSVAISDAARGLIIRSAETVRRLHVAEALSYRRAPPRAA